MQAERIIPLARRLLAIPLDDVRSDLWLWEHSERVMHLTQWLAALPDVGAGRADTAALCVAALFHDAGWAAEFRQGKWQPWQLLTRPTNDLQRELGAAMLLDEAGHLLPASTARLAATAIRQCNDRRTELLEARILAESEALDEFGVTYVLRQFRQYQAEGRPLEQLVGSWQRQQEYRYWQVRLADSFRYASTRRLAEQRLAGVGAFFEALRTTRLGDDVREWLARHPHGPAPENR